MHKSLSYNFAQIPALATACIIFVVSVAAGQGVVPTAIDSVPSPIVGPVSWKSSGVLMKPVSDGTHELVSVKDPTVVFYNNMWHVYATTANSKGNWSMVYLTFTNWSEAASAQPYYIDNNRHLKEYHCAPQVFYFRPHKKWYLIYQSQHPQYSTTDDLSKPETWTKPESFFDPNPKEMPRLPIDYWVICDDTHAYLFFTGDNGRFYRSRTKIDDFPKGMSDPQIVIEETRETLFEGSMTYKLKGTDKYLTLVEGLGPSRYYRAYTADRLDGEWTPVPGANTYEHPFAGINNVKFEQGVERWTTDISHGELIRDGYNETLTIDLKNLQMLYQGRDPASGGSYHSLPYQLGLLTLDKSAKHEVDSQQPVDQQNDCDEDATGGIHSQRGPGRARFRRPIVTTAGSGTGANRVPLHQSTLVTHVF